ncbi:MAG: hypothetical protein PHV68_05015 [Candidatus Gastranaerophilales bacterium]|nr:hypothetical protein [Candidatus Gastranaerophilales bacterium]
MTAQLNIVNKNTANVFDLTAEIMLKEAQDKYTKNNDYQYALNNIDKILMSNPTNDRALLLKGDILLSFGCKTEAIKHYQKAITVNPICAKAYSSVASILDMFGNSLEAYQYCLEAFKYADKKDYEFLVSLYDQKIAILMEIKNYREIRKTLREAAKNLSREDSEYLLSCYQTTPQKIPEKTNL